jgi:hypothetical protein
MCIVRSQINEIYTFCLPLKKCITFRSCPNWLGNGFVLLNTVNPLVQPSPTQSISFKATLVAMSNSKEGICNVIHWRYMGMPTELKLYEKRQSPALYEWSCISRHMEHLHQSRNCWLQWHYQRYYTCPQETDNHTVLHRTDSHQTDELRLASAVDTWTSGTSLWPTAWKHTSSVSNIVPLKRCEGISSQNHCKATTTLGTATTSCVLREDEHDDGRDSHSDVTMTDTSTTNNVGRSKTYLEVLMTKHEGERCKHATAHS